MSFSPTILAQVLNQANRLDFNAISKINDGDKYVKRIDCWHLLVHLINAHLSGHASMRHLVFDLKNSRQKLYHLGVQGVSLNGLSHTLANRPATVFRNFFYHLLSKCVRQKTAIKRDFKSFVSIVDATSMPFGGQGSDWAQAGKSRREAKAHVLMDAGGMPLDMVVSGASVHDIKGLSRLNLGQTEVLVMDRAYYGFNLWKSLSQKGINHNYAGKEKHALRGSPKPSWAQTEGRYQGSGD